MMLSNELASPQTEELAYQISGVIVSVLSIILSFSFVFHYFSRRSVEGYQMYFYLSISNFITSILIIARILFPSQDQSREGILYIIGIWAIRLSLFFSSVIAIFSYGVLFKNTSAAKEKQYILFGLIICAVLSALFPIMIATGFCGLEVLTFGPANSIVYFDPEDNLVKILGIVIYHLGGTLLPVVIIFYCYLKIYLELRRYLESSSRILYFIIASMVCFVPWMITEVLVSTVKFDYPFILGVTLVNLRRSEGIFFMIFMWILNPIRQNNEEGVRLLA